MSVLRHWLATSPAYSTDPTDCKYLATEDEAEEYRAAGWRVDGPYVEHHAGAVEALRAKLDEMQLHENTGDDYGSGYIDAVVEMREFLDGGGKP